MIAGSGTTPEMLKSFERGEALKSSEGGSTGTVDSSTLASSLVAALVGSAPSDDGPSDGESGELEPEHPANANPTRHTGTRNLTSPAYDETSERGPNEEQDRESGCRCPPATLVA